MNIHRAACYCGNLSADVSFSKPVAEYEPRACDCNFCEKHAAAYVSDAAGKLNIQVQDGDQLGSCQHGSGLANFLFCRSCGVMFAVTFQLDEQLFGSLNSRTLQDRRLLNPPQPASPRLLSDSEKQSRWSKVWFPDVTISLPP